MRTGLSFSTAPKNPTKHPFFKLPKEPELPEYKSIAEQQQIVERKYKYPIRYMKPGAMTGIKKEMMDHGFDKHNGESCTGKYAEDKDHLCDTIDFPAGLEFLKPLRCGQVDDFMG